MNNNYLQKFMFCLLLTLFSACGSQKESPHETRQRKNVAGEKSVTFQLTPLTRLDAEIGLSSPGSIAKHPKGGTELAQWHKVGLLVARYLARRTDGRVIPDTR